MTSVTPAATEATMRRLALDAGAAIMAIYESGVLEAREKADASPVTAADLAADRIICDGLSAAFPDIPIVTEERAESHARGVGGAHFLVDPLDGTREFVQRRGEFTVNIALIKDGTPVEGVVFAPAIGRLFRTKDGAAVEETGALAPDRAGPTRRLAAVTPGPGGLVVVASKSHRDAATDAYIGRYDVAEFRSAGSSLKFCLVAAGEAHLYPRLGRTMEWDTAAGHAVLAAAGGRVLRFDDGAPLRYSRPSRANPFFVAASPGVTVLAP